MKTKSLTLPCFAKINLFLRILGKRPDNFHEICTAFQTISLHDQITFTEADSLTLTSNDKKIPTDKKNLIIKAGNLLVEKFNVKSGANIYLNKNIPFPGGLGGGSSNAAIALLGLSTLWQLDISFEELADIGSRIGSDVPFFFYGGTAVGYGRGERIRPVIDYKEKFIVIVTPNIDIPTAKAYSELNAQDLTNIDSKSILKICREAGHQLESRQFEFINDFEDNIFRIKTEIGLIKEKFLYLGATTALLSGSGASVFAIFDNEEKQQVALGAFESEANIRKFAVKTISRQEYRKFLKPCEHLLPKSF